MSELRTPWGISVIFLFLSALASAQVAPLSERLTRAVALIELAKEGPLPAPELKVWQGLLPQTKVAIDSSRVRDLSHWIKEQVGLSPQTKVNLEKVPTRAKGGHEVYRVRYADKKVILKVFLGAEAFDEVLREIAADETLRRSKTTLKGIQILAVGILNAQPAIVMESAPGESVAKLLAKDFARGKEAITATSKALAEFHQKVKRAVDPKHVPWEVTDYRGREHHRKIRRWLTVVDKPTPTLQAIQKKGWVSTEEATRLKSLLEKAFDAYESKPVSSTTIVHGDCHPKNLYYDAATKQVTAIDTAFMGWTLRAVGDPMEDLGRAVEGSLLVLAQNNLPEAKFEEIVTAWVQNYAAPVDPDALKYYRLRFLQLLMDGEPFTREQARALLKPFLNP